MALTVEQVTFKINGKQYTVKSTDPGISPGTPLNTFIREHANLRGTKSMCYEGGCGVCIVHVKSQHPVSKKDIHYAVNSCLVTVLSCEGWEITTVEGLGNQKTGYNQIQKSLADHSGTQCGFCSPGMVMNMYSLLMQNDNKLTKKEIEDSFGGSLCRCTGYRPIADAFKTFASDNDDCAETIDIEDFKICKKTGQECQGTCTKSIEPAAFIEMVANGTQWFKVSTVAEIYKILNDNSTAKYMLVGGNTLNGVFRRASDFTVYIDVSTVAELQQITVTATQITIGANLNLTAFMNLMRSAAKDNANFAYCNEIADHVDLIANVPVRNIGTIAGNLYGKWMYNDFPSDIFLLLETFAAQLVIGSKDGSKQTVSPQQFLKLDMKGKVILQVILKPYDTTYKYRTYKIMPRNQNTHADVNAGFLFKLNTNNTVAEATIVYGNINTDFIHAKGTETFLIGKNLYDDAVLQQVFASLEKELVTHSEPPEASPEYRKNMAIALFYKCVLSIVPQNQVNSAYISGGQKFNRPVSTAKQEFQSNSSEYPLTQPIPKLEAQVQTSGEAVFAYDHPETLGRDLYGNFVLAHARPKSTIKRIDTSAAFQIPGVVAFIDKTSVPGENTFIPVEEMPLFTEKEELFCNGTVLFNGQPVGVILATSTGLANVAAALVTIEYNEYKGQPFLTSRQVLDDKIETQKRVRLERTVKATTKGTDIAKTITGSFDIHGQYHFTMETQTCACIPTEDALEVYSSTQWMDLTQKAIGVACGLPENRINVHVRRLGGGYGAKISRATQTAAACAVAAVVTNRPVHIHMNFENNMDAVGKRFPCTSDYTIKVDAKGKIQDMNIAIYQNYGIHFNEPVAAVTATNLLNCYDSSTWDITAHGVRTDVAANTFCRAPSTTEGIAMAEALMEHIAYSLNLDPTSVRLANMHSNDNPLPQLIADFKKQTDFDSRKASLETFNKNNRWRKRGLALVPMQYRMEIYGNFHCMITIYSGDATVAVAHGGIEMGQGLNTKVAQVVAYQFGIDLDMVSVKPSNTLTAPNDFTTGYSVGSEACCKAALKACAVLLQRLQPIRESLGNPTWKTLINTASLKNVDLCASDMMTAEDIRSYNIWGVSIAEVELDILTGQYQLMRVDILEDTGESMSPIVDVGQVEGAFIMGLGYWTTEKLIYNPDDGKLLTNRTWNYRVPGMKDIPVDFRVTFRKNAPNPVGVLRSKATGEPALCMSIVVPLAIRNAVSYARKDSNASNSTWYNLDGPTTTENAFLNCLTPVAQYKLK